MTTVVLVDDHPIVRQGMRAVIDVEDDIEVVGEASDGAEAVRVCVRTQPDVMLMDLHMPELSGIEATKQVRTRSPSTAVLVLTMYDDDEMVFEAVAAGAAGYLLKGSDGTDVVAAIRSVAQGQAIFGAALAQRMRTWFTRPRRQESPFPELSDREREILDGVAAGLTNAEIGAKLFLSPKTVANNVSILVDKLHFAHRTDAIIKARQAGLGERRLSDDTRSVD
jgi:DNA-binding NarL/FixJ family response regulator